MSPNLPNNRFLETHRNIDSSKFSIDCCDPLGRSALVLAIENENMELIQILLKHGASPGDSLLHAISEEYVEAVETLLIHEESIHEPNKPYVSRFLCMSTHELISLPLLKVMGEDRSQY